MIALDTNVLVRLVTRDDEAQAQRARAVFEEHAVEVGGLFVADIVLVELCWTLARSYELSRADIALVVQLLISVCTLARMLMTFPATGAVRDVMVVVV